MLLKCIMTMRQSSPISSMTGGKNSALCSTPTLMATLDGGPHQLQRISTITSRSLKSFSHTRIRSLLGLVANLVSLLCHPSISASLTSMGWLYSAHGTLAGTLTLSMRNSKVSCGKVPASRCLVRCVFFGHGLLGGRLISDTAQPYTRCRSVLAGLRAKINHSQDTVHVG